MSWAIIAEIKFPKPVPRAVMSPSRAEARAAIVPPVTVSKFTKSCPTRAIALAMIPTTANPRVLNVEVAKVKVAARLEVTTEIKI